MESKEEMEKKMEEEEEELDAKVLVWNCRAILYVNGQPLDEEKLSDKQREAIERIKDYVIYTVNGGAINWSGIYEFDAFSLLLLSKVLKGDTECVKEIDEPEDSDFREVAKRIISGLRSCEGVMVYSSALSCGCSDLCRGYHNHKYVIKSRSGKLGLFDDGFGHHVAFSTAHGITPTLGARLVKVISEDEAIELLADYLRLRAERERWTKAELLYYEPIIYKKHGDEIIPY